MRYRPFGRSGVTTSAVALNVSDASAAKGPNALKELIFTALEAGINAYHISGDDPELPRIVGQTLLATVERRLVFISQDFGEGRGRVGKKTRDFSPEGLTRAIDHTLTTSGLDHLDLVILDEPGAEELPRESLAALKAIRSQGQISLIGIAGENDAMDAYISSGSFDVLTTPYHLRSGWKERNRLKAATEHDMAVVAYNWYPEELTTARKVQALAAAAQPKRGLFGGLKDAVAGEPPRDNGGTYQFLHATKNWTAEELCLAYALTEPALSTILLDPADPAHLAALAQVPDREMPPGLAAQIEMARFGALN